METTDATGPASARRGRARSDRDARTVVQAKVGDRPLDSLSQLVDPLSAGGEVDCAPLGRERQAGCLDLNLAQRCVQLIRLFDPVVGHLHGIEIDPPLAHDRNQAAGVFAGVTGTPVAGIRQGAVSGRADLLLGVDTDPVGSDGVGVPRDSVVVARQGQDGDDRDD
jgi:hypothetical protein